MTLLVVGMGGVGQRHVRNLRRLRGTSIALTAVRTRGLTRVLTDRLEVEPGRDVCEAYGIREVATLESALAERPDGVLVCNPTSMHVPVALAAARAGCTVFVEKPLSDSWNGVDELLSLAERHRTTGMVGYQMRFHPCMTRLKAIVDARAVGHIVSVRAYVGDYMPAWHGYEDYRDLYASRRNLGGGVILTQIHELDYLGWLFGSPRRVFALGGRWSALDVDVEDTASLLMDVVIDGRVVPIHVHQDFLTRPAMRTCEVVGEDGFVSVDWNALTVRVTDREGRDVETSSFSGADRNEMFVAEMDAFLACVEGRGAPMVDLHEGARSLRAALAARASIERGEAVAVA